MTNTNTTLAAHSDIVTAEAAWFGTTIGIEIRSAHTAPTVGTTDADVPSAITVAWERWDALCARYGWSDADRDSGWPTLVDAYYDRATGKA